MDKAVELLKEACKTSSQRQVARGLGISATAVNLLLKGKYPNPTAMFELILKVFDEPIEIIGAENKQNIEELMKELS